MTGMPGSVISASSACFKLRLAAPGQEAVDVVVVHEAGHQVRPRVQALAGMDAVTQIGRGPATRKHIAQGPVQREVEHARQQRAAVRARHVALDLARGLILKRLVDAEAFAKDVELRVALCVRATRSTPGARRPGACRKSAKARRHIERRVHTEGIHPHLADPVP
jgi:hypothetical protein